MNQQGNLIPNSTPEKIAVPPINYIREYRHATNGRYYAKNPDGTSSLISGSGPSFALTTGAANTYSYVTTDDVPPYLGKQINVMINVQNTGASTIAVNGLPALPITKQNGVAVASADLKAGYVYSMLYIVGDTNSYQVISSL